MDAIDAPIMAEPTHRMTSDDRKALSKIIAVMLPMTSMTIIIPGDNLQAANRMNPIRAREDVAQKTLVSIAAVLLLKPREQTAYAAT
jgi:hypothetical protein